MGSNNKTVLFAPINAHGHINIFVGLADKLRDDHGYRSVFLLVEPAIDSVIKKHKHELVEVKSRIQKNPEENGEKMSKFTKTTRNLCGDFNMEPVERFIMVMGHLVDTMVEDLEYNHELYCDAVRRIKPDLLVTEYLFTIPGFKEAIGDTPWIQLFQANPLSRTTCKLSEIKQLPFQVGVSLKKSKSLREKLRKERPEEWRALVDDWRVLSERIEESNVLLSPRLKNFLKKQGDEFIGMYDEKRDSPYLNIRVYPAEIDYDREDDLCCYRKRWIRCDSLIRYSIDQEEASIWNEKLRLAMKGKSKMIYFSLGTLASDDLDLMRKYIKILSESSEYLYVISKGNRGDEFELNDENMIGSNYLPQTFILQRADLAIIHGGNNSLTECLYNGVPMIILPVFTDQFDNAQRIEDLELGRRLNIHKCTREELLGAIEELLSNETLVEEVHQIGANMKSRDDAHNISLLLKKLIDEGSLDESFIDRYNKGEKVLN